MEEKLLNLRDYNDLTQEEIAKIIGVKRTTYSSWENGSITIPLKHLNTLCNYYNVSMDYFCGFTNIKNDKGNVKLKEVNKILIGYNIRYIRYKFNLTLRDVAKLLNTSPSTISAYENGRTLILTSFAYQICKKYNISMDWLCCRSDNINIHNKSKKVRIKN